jgi:hypothetical protein
MKRVASVVAVLLVLCASVVSAQYNTTVYHEQGGNKEVVASGGAIEVQSGGTLELQSGATLTAAGFITNTHVAAAANIARSKLATDLLATFGKSVFDLRQPTGIPLVATETAGTMNVSVSGNVILAQGEITDNETEVSVVQYQFTLPPSYVTGGAIRIYVPCKVVKTGGATDNGSTIDVSAYYQMGQSVGADLVTTAAQTFAALDQSYAKWFSVDPATLAAGATLNIVVTSSIIDSEAGAGTLRFNMDAPYLQLDVKG